MPRDRHTYLSLDFYAFHARHVVHIDASPRMGLSASDAGAVGDRGPNTDVSGSWTIQPGAGDTLRIDYKVSRLDELLPWAYPTIPGLKAAA